MLFKTKEYIIQRNILRYFRDNNIFYSTGGITHENLMKVLKEFGKEKEILLNLSKLKKNGYIGLNKSFEPWKWFTNRHSYDDFIDDILKDRVDIVERVFTCVISIIAIVISIISIIIK